MPPRLMLGLLLALAPLASCGPRCVIDRKSCAGDKYDIVKKAVELSTAMAREAGDHMSLPADKQDPRVTEKGEWLLGTPNRVGTAIYTKTADRFKAISQFQLYDTDPYSASWKKEKKAEDMVIVCNADHIEERTGTSQKAVYHNLISGEPVSDTAKSVGIKRGSAESHAMLTNPSNSNEPQIMVINPPWMDGVIKTKSFLTPERIRRAKDPQRLAEMEKIWKARPENARKTFTGTIMDYLKVFDCVILHEMMHSRVAGRATDEPKGGCYMWRNIIKCQNPNNADSLMYLSLSIHLILSEKLEPTKDGGLTEIN